MRQFVAAFIVMIFALAGCSDLAAAPETVFPETVTIQLPEQTGDDEAFDQFVSDYADALIAAGFTADPSMPCECLTGPRDVAERITEAYVDTDGDRHAGVLWMKAV